jgi:hypothetical protein
MATKNDALIDRRFFDERIDLTKYLYVYGCYFDGCIVEFNRDGRDHTLVENWFKDCQLIGDGWPEGVRSKTD